VVGPFGQEDHVLEAGLADLVEDDFDVAVLGAGVGFEVDGFLGAVMHRLLQKLRKVGGPNASVGKVDFSVARDCDHEGIVSPGVLLRRRVICVRHIDRDLQWKINSEAGSHQKGKQSEDDAGECRDLYGAA
jgi:hypothetical protein